MEPTAQDLAACARKRHWDMQSNADAHARRMQNLHPKEAPLTSYQCGACGRYCLSTPMDQESNRRHKKRRRR